MGKRIATAVAARAAQPHRFAGGRRGDRRIRGVGGSWIPGRGRLDMERDPSAETNSED
jgi:hypothetical protein